MVHKSRKTMNGTVYKIWSKSVDRNGKLVNWRTEYIDTSKNVMFKGASNEADVKNAFESFWGIGGDEKIVVDKVQKVNVKSRGDNWDIKMG